MGREIKDWAKYTDKTKEKGRQKKSRLLSVGLFVVLVLVGYRFFPTLKLFWVGLKQETITEQSVSSPPGSTLRKNIYDRSLQVVATSVETTSIYVKPREFEDIGKTVQELASILDFEEAKLLEELKTERNFTWLSRNMSLEKAQQVQALDLAGMYFVNKKQRVYPTWPNAPQLVGQVKDDVGLSGLEFTHNDTLLSGRHLVLTIDLELQARLEQLLEVLIEKTGYKQGGSLLITNAFGMVMDPNTGEVLASATLPYSQHFYTSVPAGEEVSDGMATPSVKIGGFSALFDLAEAVDSGFRKPEDAESEGGTSKVIAPRMEKLVKYMPSAPWWQLDKEKNIVSPWLVSIAKEVESARNQIGDVIPRQEKGKELYRGVGLTEDQVRTSSAGHLLESFSSLINKGKSISPHILLATASDDGTLNKEEEKGPISADIFNFDKDESMLFRSLLEETSSAKTHFFVAQSLQKSLPEKQIKEGMFDEDGDEIVVKTTGQQKISGVGSGDNTILYDGTILSAVPLHNPRLTMLLSFSHGMVDVTKPSAMTQPISEFLQKALHQARNSKKLKEREEFQEIDTEQIIASLQMRQQGGSVQARTITQESVTQIMPDVRGLSLRKALRAIEPLGLRVMVEGMGTVVNQHPSAGSRIVNDECVLLAKDRVQELKKSGKKSDQ